MQPAFTILQCRSWWWLQRKNLWHKNTLSYTHKHIRTQTLSRTAFLFFVQKSREGISHCTARGLACAWYGIIFDFVTGSHKRGETFSSSYNRLHTYTENKISNHFVATRIPNRMMKCFTIVSLHFTLMHKLSCRWPASCYGFYSWLKILFQKKDPFVYFLFFFLLQSSERKGHAIM